MRHYDTAVFDLDGTLLNTLGDLAASANYALARHAMPPRTLDEIRRFVGNGVGLLMARAVPEGTPPEVLDAALADFRAHYAGHIADHTAPYPGVPELLHTLAEQNFRLAVVSNKLDGPVRALCRRFFPDTIPVAIGEVPGVPKKPAPDSVFHALERLGSDPARAVYIGDSDVDIATARAAALPCISVSWGFRDAAFLAAHGAAAPIAATPAQLLELLLREE